MKRVTIVWLVFVFLAGLGGFALSMSHNRPRLAVNAYSLDLFLMGPDTTGTDPTTTDPTTTDPTTTPPPPPPPTTADNDCNEDGKADTNWDILECRFNQYKDVDKIPSKIEDWRIWDKDSNGQNKLVKVHYNTVTDEIVIFCEKKKCEAQ